MRHLFMLLLVLASVIPVGAHLGNENNTEIRIFSDRMRVVIRTSIPFAWTLLGNQAPPMADEAGQASAKPRLISAAPGLIRVTSGGKPLEPTETDCIFEVGNDVAFILNFNRPGQWPVVVEATYFDRFTSLDTGMISVFDYTASRFTRDLKPIAEKVISQGDPSLSFSLTIPAAAERETASPPAPAPVLPPNPPQPRRIIWLIVLAGLAGVWIAWKLRRL